jgi:protein tyrosine phosphatase (PTP) superfamily phosphohydrolase (DUF442 family)
MKSIIIFAISSFLLLINLDAQDKTKNSDTIEVITDFNNFFRYQNIYLGGQPSLEALQWLKYQGVKKIINLRSDSENNEYSEYAYNEETNAQKLGFEYHSVPVDGAQDYSPEKLNDFLSLVNDDEKIFIHCLSGGRATNFLMAYLIKQKGYTINMAVEKGRSLRFSFPLEKLLDVEVSMEIIE